MRGKIIGIVVLFLLVVCAGHTYADNTIIRTSKVAVMSNEELKINNWYQGQFGITLFYDNMVTSQEQGTFFMNCTKENMVIIINKDLLYTVPIKDENLNDALAACLETKYPNAIQIIVSIHVDNHSKK